MNRTFYRAFEERYRGSRDLIKSRLRSYLPFVEPLRGLYSQVNAVDLGCGRGEWLELLKEVGFDAQGVDLDDSMLAVCRDIGLKVQICDAVEFLKGLPDESQVIVSGFHIAEHMAFTDLEALVQEAFRVLKPAGLLILETPNSENIVVGSSNFYLDPTHQRPVPPLLLAFIPEYYGFARVKTLRLQESADLSSISTTRLLDVLSGVSPDFSVVAQKGATQEQMKLFETDFEKIYGLNLEVLAQRYEERIAKVEAMSEQSEARLNNIQNTRLWRALRWMNGLIQGIKKGLW